MNRKWAWCPQSHPSHSACLGLYTRSPTIPIDLHYLWRREIRLPPRPQTEAADPWDLTQFLHKLLRQHLTPVIPDAFMEASTFAGSEHLAPVGLLFRPEPHSKNTEVTSLNKGSGNPKGGVRRNRDPEHHEAWTQHEAEVHPSQRDGLGWP